MNEWSRCAMSELNTFKGIPVATIVGTAISVWMSDSLILYLYIMINFNLDLSMIIWSFQSFRKLDNVPNFINYALCGSALQYVFLF